MAAGKDELFDCDFDDVPLEGPQTTRGTLNAEEAAALPDSKGNWPSKIISKATKMENKTVEVRNMFNLPSTEVVIQDYYCSLEQTIKHGGRMWITPNYVCFYSGLPFQITEHFAFRMVKKFVFVDSVLSGGITVELKDGKVYKFYSFMKIQETYAVLRHLWEIPPSYVVLDNEEEDEIGVKNDGGLGNIFGDKPKDGKKSYHVKVDESKKAVKLAEKSRDKGIDILVELDSQQERLDRIEGTVDNIHHNLDRGDRHLRGIGSVGGACANLVTRNKSARHNPKIQKRESIAQQRWAEDFKNVHLEVLLKQSDDTLVNCTLFFGPTQFLVKEKATDRTMPQCAWEYAQIKFLVMRARPLHLDVRFRDNSPRFRMMASRIQAITNELVLRSNSAKKRKNEEPARVLFEPNSRRFDYGSYFLTLEVIRLRDGTTQIVAKKATGTAALLSDEVDDTTKRKVEQAEANMKQVHGIAEDLEKIGKTMGETLDDQNKQIDRIHNKTTRAKDRVENQNRAVQDINRDLD